LSIQCGSIQRDMGAIVSVLTLSWTLPTYAATFTK